MHNAQKMTSWYIVLLSRYGCHDAFNSIHVRTSFMVGRKDEVKSEKIQSQMERNTVLSLKVSH